MTKKDIEKLKKGISETMKDKEEAKKLTIWLDKVFKKHGGKSGQAVSG